ncbi:hypothetical protein Y032_0305g1945 [Ancylostoma ceylanicum]|uniref:Uncharacterized protein n=1 Tax=Ancylostoma ceylanicum TaxID=53326 RepID=A0A016S3P7_9BILA|nr:hypothetical protein Y032_0305g1945 [Ancylostoma ceylanicum]
MAESASTQPPSNITSPLPLSNTHGETVPALTTTVEKDEMERKVIVIGDKPAEKESGSDMMIIFIAGAAFIFVVGVAFAAWYVYDRKKRAEKFKLMTKLANEESKRKKKKKRRVKLSRGPKPVIKVKPNEEIRALGRPQMLRQKGADFGLQEVDLCSGSMFTQYFTKKKYARTPHTTNKTKSNVKRT